MRLSRASETANEVEARCLRKTYDSEKEARDRGPLVALVVLLAWLGLRREKTEADDGAHPVRTSVPVAAVVRVTRGTLGSPLTLAGAFKPFQDVDVHAKVAGYIKAIYVDVGSHVKDGQTLAVLEVPELQAQLLGADAAVRRAKEEISRVQSDLQGAKSTHAAVHAMYERLKPGGAGESGVGSTAGSGRRPGKRSCLGGTGSQRRNRR